MIGVLMPVPDFLFAGGEPALPTRELWYERCCDVGEQILGRAAKELRVRMFSGSVAVMSIDYDFFCMFRFFS